MPRYSVYLALALSGALRALVWDFKTILYGGAGKNGSSVAVSFVHHDFFYTLIIFFKYNWERNANIPIYNFYQQGTSVLSPVIPFSLVLIPAILIAGNSKDDLYRHYPAVYILTFGLVAAKVTNRLVVN